MNVQQPENDLWEAADQLQADGGGVRDAGARLDLSAPCRQPLQGLPAHILAGISAKMPAAQREKLIKIEFEGKAAIYLPDAAPFDAIASVVRSKSVHLSARGKVSFARRCTHAGGHKRPDRAAPETSRSSQG